MHSYILEVRVEWVPKYTLNKIQLIFYNIQFYL